MRNTKSTLKRKKIRNSILPHNPKTQVKFFHCQFVGNLEQDFMGQLNQVQNRYFKFYTKTMSTYLNKYKSGIYKEKD